MIETTPLFSYPEWRNIYIDEINNDWNFRRNVKRFIKKQKFEDPGTIVMVINGYIDAEGVGMVNCQSLNIVP